jgi:hypothetical protein
LALLLAVFGALAPTVSHALVWARGDAAPIEICTSAGPRWMALGQPETNADPSSTPVSAQVLDHCPFCLLFADRAAPPPHCAVDRFAVREDARAATPRQIFLALSFFAVTPPLRGPPTPLNF